MVEYGVLVGLIALICAATITAIVNVFNTVVNDRTNNNKQYLRVPKREGGHGPLFPAFETCAGIR
jgi:hypothetical protein